jgi:inosine-uridine nucleoside N-ribohydrolase
MVDLHIDTDIGGDVDDLCALAMALGWPDCDLTDISTVHDGDGMRAALAYEAIHLAGLVEPMPNVGAAGTISDDRPTPGTFEVSRFWGDDVSPFSDSAGAVSDQFDWTWIGHAIAAIGPFTNLAVYESLRTGRLAQSDLVVMGGWLQQPPDGYPQWGPNMDWNVQSDQVAARIVYERCDPLVVPLHVTVQTYVTETHIKAIEDYGPLPALIAKLARLYADERGHRDLATEHSGLPEGFLNFQHDPLAVAVALGWDGVTIEELQIAPVMRDGNLVLAPGGDKPLRVVTSVDAAALADAWVDCLRRIH